MPLIASRSEYSTMADPRTGKPCHRDSHTKETKGSYRAARRADALGLHVAYGVLDTRTGIGVCALCGGDGTLALGDNGRSAALTLELAHDVPQAHGGAVCWCSMVLAHATCNRAQGEARLTEFNLHTDARVFAAMGGVWAPWTGDRANYSYDSTRARKCAARRDGWVPRTVTGEDLCRDIWLSDWR